MATQARAVLKIPARIVGAGDVSVSLENGIYIISTAKPSSAVGINSQIGTTYTFTADDALKLVTFSNPNPVTAVLSTGLGLGFFCRVAQIGGGNVTFTGSGGAVVNSLGGQMSLLGQYSAGWLCAYAPDTFLLVVEGQSIDASVYDRATSLVGTVSISTVGTKVEIIDAGAVTSAGIYDSTGLLVRTLWNTEIGNSHRNNPAAGWDGTLEDGTVAPSGAYTAKVVAHNCTYTWEGVIGNTSPDHSTMRYWNDAGGVSDMEIYSDGKMYYVSGYHERLPTMGYSMTSDVQNMDYAVDISFRASYSNMIWVTTDGTNLYYGHWEGSSTFIVGVTIATKAIINFASGSSWAGFPSAAVAVDSSPTAWISSIAVQRGGSGRLFVCRPTSALLTINKATGAILQTNTSFTTPTLVEINPLNDDLWLCHKVGGAWKITKCAVDGAGVVTLTATQTTTSISDPRSMSISYDGTTLLLADAGSAQQVLAFNTSDASLKTTWATSGKLGVAGGYATSPSVTNTKFMFERMSIFGAAMGWVAYAPDGSFWVGDSGNYRHLHFSSGLNPTYIETVMFMPSFYSCGVCRGDSTRVFVDFLEFTINYGIALGVNNGSWALSKNWGYGYPNNVDQYGRLRFPTLASNGKTYAAFDAGGGRRWFELTSTGLRDTGAIFSNGSYVDADMNQYYTLQQGVFGDYGAISINPLTGFDGANNPTYTYPSDWSASDSFLVTGSLPSNFPYMRSWDNNIVQNNRVEATANNVIPFFDGYGQRDWNGTSRLKGINFLGGVDATTGAPRFATLPSHGGPSPGENKGGRDRRFLLYPEVPYFATQGSGPNGGGVFAYAPGSPHIFVCNIAEGGWGNNQTNIWYHYHDSGLLLGQFGVAAPYYASTSLTHPGAMGDGVPNYFYSFKALDGMAGNSKWGGLAEVNGVTYLYQNDEWYQGGLHRWKIEDLDSLVVNTYDLVWDADDYVAPATDTSNLLAGLPLDQINLPNGTAGWTRVPTTNSTADSGAWARVLTNVIHCDPRGVRDITFEASFTNATASSLSRAIPRVTSGDWTLEGKIYLIASDFNNAYAAFEILDNTGKILFTIYNFTTPGSQGCKVNGVNLVTPDTSGHNRWLFETEREVPFSVIADVSAATMNITYSGHTSFGVTVFEVGANLSAPATVRLKYYAPTTPGVVGLGMGNISELRYTEV